MHIHHRAHKILAVDDDPAILRLIASTLEPNGFQVLQALDGFEGVAKAREHKPALVLLDIRMPQMDGFEACRALQCDAATAEIPVIFLTAERNTDANLARGFGVGGCDYIVKPFSRVELNLRVMSAIQSRLPVT